MLITGLVLWWPKKWNKHNRLKSFRIKRDAGFKRLNYDLHNVTGFYFLLILLVMAITGSWFGYKWFSKSVYFVAAGGKSQPVFKKPLSDSTLMTTKTIPYPADSLYEKYAVTDGALFIFFPKTNSDPVQVSVNPHPEKNYALQIYYHDQYTLKALEAGGPFAKPFGDASFADQLSRLNYDIHTGQVGGLITKILVFLAGLVAASLPITGFMIWLNKKKKKNVSIKKSPFLRVA